MKTRIITIVLFCSVVMGFPNVWGQAESPTGQVRSILEGVMVIQGNPRLKGPEFRDQQRTAIGKIIGDNFHFDSMVRKALGAQWTKLDKAGQEEFEGIFKELFQHSYTKLVLDFLKREKILYLQEKREHDHAVVKTTIIRTNERIPVDYSLARAQERWLVEDVSIDGVSIVLNYQRSFTRVIKRESYQSLLKKMRLQQKAVEKPSR